MDQFLRRGVLAGLPGLLAACSSSPRREPDTLAWLLGEWQGGYVGQQLAVTSVDPQNEMALGAWSGEPVYIIVNGGQLRFATNTGLQVQLSHRDDATMIGSIGGAPWLRRPLPAPLFVTLRRQVRAV